MSDQTQERQLKVALSLLLESNFDDDSRVCITTLLKVLDNVLQKPGNSKVRSIRMTNPHFSQKVVQRPGGVNYLVACGFTQQINPPDLLSTAEAGDPYLVLHAEDEDSKHLILARRLLIQTAKLELHMKAEDLPKYKPPPATVRASEAASSRADTFDVYRGNRFDAKSAATGASLGPDGEYVSTTETKLRQLQQKQERLEAKIQRPLMDRELVVTLPGKQPALGHVSLTTASAAGPSDGALLAQCMQRLEQERREREEGGFQTKAMRDLKAMEKAKVYTHTLLRIQFSDESVLEGKFLPKEKVQVVKDVILGHCCLENLDLDLYVAPPRRKLDFQKALTDEGLVPAAKVFGSWKVGHSPPKNDPVGSFWKPELLASGVDSTGTSFPSARSIVEESSNVSSSKGSGSGGAVTSSSREDDLMRRMMGKKSSLGSSKGAARKSNSKDGAGGGGKPKWFKG